ncbi:MAG: FtsL-like putative cell division protein [Tannerella forsythia]|uniref:FtsL-like putative cell division protein n=1 Tax=Tannerella forsythia TaxID=28112 RepID=UPI003613EC61
MNETNKIRQKKKRHLSPLYILGGGILKEDFIVRHTKLIVLIVGLMLMFISNRYTCLLKLREIDKLQQELKDVKYESLAVSGQLIGNNRLSQIELLVRKKGLDLESPQTPPYIIQK